MSGPKYYEELKSYVRRPSPKLPKEAISRKPDEALLKKAQVSKLNMSSLDELIENSALLV